MERFLICPEDSYLARTFQVFGPLKVDQNQVETDVPFLKNLLGLLACFPTSYSGLCPAQGSALGATEGCQTYSGLCPAQALAGVHLVAGMLKDHYDLDSNRLERRKNLPQAYYSLIAQQASKELYLIALDKSWVLAGIRDYINLFSPFKAEDLSIYRFDKWYMIFGPVSAQTQEKIFTWIYQNRKMFDARSSVATQRKTDFELIYPVESSKFAGFTLYESTILNQDQLEAAFDENKMVYKIDGLSHLKAAYASYLTMENTNFNYPIVWNNDRLEIWNAGYIGSEDIRLEWIRVLGQIETSGIIFTRLDSSGEAVLASQVTGAKTFYTSGNWYGAFTQDTPWLSKGPADMKNLLIDLVFPLSTFHGRTGAIRECNSMGYSTDDDPFLFDIPIGYQTLTDGSNINTIYYYNTTSGMKIEFLTLPGTNSLDRQQTVQALVNRGQFLNPVAKSLSKRYPTIIFGYPPVFPDFLKDDLKLNLER